MKILDIIDFIYTNKFKKIIDNSIRPMTFRDNNSGYYWLQGTGFSLQYGDDLLFLTARHNFIKKDLYQDEDNSFTALKENLNNFFIIKHNHFCDLKDTREVIQEEIDNTFIHSILPKDSAELSNIGLPDEDLNDLAVVTFSKNFAKEFLKDNNFIKLNYNTPRISTIDDTEFANIDDIVFVTGHCLSTNSGNFVNPIFNDDGKVIKSEMSLKRNYIFGKVINTNHSDTNFFTKVEVIANIDNLETLNGFSGSPVFIIKDKKIKLTGMIIRGGEKYFYFISISFIRTYLMMNDIEIMQIGNMTDYKKQFSEIKVLLQTYNIDILEHNSEQKKIEFEVDDKPYVISYKYTCHIFALKILLKNIQLFSDVNLHLLSDICFHIHDSDKYEKINGFFDKNILTTKLIEQVSKKYTDLISQGKKFLFSDMFVMEAKNVK